MHKRFHSQWVAESGLPAALCLSYQNTLATHFTHTHTPHIHAYTQSPFTLYTQVMEKKVRVKKTPLTVTSTGVAGHDSKALLDLIEAENEMAANDRCVGALVGWLFLGWLRGLVDGLHLYRVVCGTVSYVLSHRPWE